ncbi:MAG: hypothetical protein ACRDSR_02770 [Pseudonocardiaceae bacterium]
MSADSTKATTPDWVVIGAGLLAYISSFLPWYRAQISILGVDRSAGENAWGAGFGAWFSVLLLVAAGAVVLLGAMGLRLPTPRPLITLGLSALALITILLRWATLPDHDSGRFDLGDVEVDGLFTVSTGAGLGLYLGLIAAAVAVVASLLAARTTRG